MLSWDMERMHEDWNKNQMKAMKEKREEQRKEKLEASKQISTLDFEIWSLQVNPTAQNIVNSEENIRRFAQNIRGFNKI